MSQRRRTKDFHELRAVAMVGVILVLLVVGRLIQVAP